MRCPSCGVGIPSERRLLACLRCFWQAGDEHDDALEDPRHLDRERFPGMPRPEVEGWAS